MFNRVVVIFAGLLLAQLMAWHFVDSAKTRRHRSRPVQSQQPAVPTNDYSEFDYYENYEDYEDNRNGK